MSRRAARGVLGIAYAALLLIGAILVGTGVSLLRGAEETSPSPTPTSAATAAAVATTAPPSAAASVTASSSPSAEAPAAPSAIPREPGYAPSAPVHTHENSLFGYAISIPAPWRLSFCLSAIFVSEQQTQGHDIFTARTEADEQNVPQVSSTTGQPLWDWTVTVSVMSNPDRLDARGYYHRSGGSVAQFLEDATVDGRPALRVSNGVPHPLVYLVPRDDRMYVLGFELADGAPHGVSVGAFEWIVASFRFSPISSTHPSPSPKPALAQAEALADALADALRRRDADAVAPLLTPKCRISDSYANAGGVSLGPREFLERLRRDFAEGLEIRVEPRPLLDGPNGMYALRSTWSGYGTSDEYAEIWLGAVDGRWYWVGVLRNADRR